MDFALWIIIQLFSFFFGNLTGNLKMSNVTQHLNESFCDKNWRRVTLDKSSAKI